MRYVGLERSKHSLEQAFIEFDRIERESKHLSAKLKDMLLVSRLITYAAMQRQESRGTHYRSDFVKMNLKLNQSKVFTANEMYLFVEEYKKQNLNKIA